MADDHEVAGFIDINDCKYHLLIVDGKCIMTTEYQVFFETPDTAVGPVCLPATWKPQDVQFFTSKYLSKTDAIIELQDGCDSESPFLEDSSHRLYLCVLVAWITMVIASQFVSRTEPASTSSKLISCLSIRDNFHTLTRDERDQMDFFYGFRIIFLVYSVYVHAFQDPILFTPMAIINGARYQSPIWFKLIETQWINGMALNFVWSAFLGFRSRIGKSLAVREIVSQIISRFLRTVPTVLGCYLLILSVPRSLGSGPLWNSSINKLRANCEANFWNEITYTQYLINPFNYCIGPSWILGPDLYFFLASLVIIAIYKWNRSLGKSLIILMIPVGVIAQIAFLILNGYSGLSDLTKFDESTIREGFNMHTRPLNYISSYMLGLIAAIICHENSSVCRRLKEMSIISGISVLAMEVWRISWNWRMLERPEEVAFVALHKTVTAIFGSSFTALIYQYSCRDEGNILVSLLSCKLFKFIGKFNFSIYLAHALLIYYELFTITRPIEFSILQFLVRTAYITILSIPFGVMIYLLFEAPSGALAKLIASSMRGKPPAKSC